MQRECRDRFIERQDDDEQEAEQHHARRDPAPVAAAALHAEHQRPGCDHDRRRPDEARQERAQHIEAADGQRGENRDDEQDAGDIHRLARIRRIGILLTAGRDWHDGFGECEVGAARGQRCTRRAMRDEHAISESRGASKAFDAIGPRNHSGTRIHTTELKNREAPALNFPSRDARHSERSAPVMPGNAPSNCLFFLRAQERARNVPLRAGGRHKHATRTIWETVMAGFSRTSLVPLIVAFGAFGIVTSPGAEAADEIQNAGTTQRLRRFQARCDPSRSSNSTRRRATAPRGCTRTDRMPRHATRPQRRSTHRTCRS